MSVLIQILAIIVCIALACSLLGPFLILKNISMMVDAISHTILLGIVLAFFLIGDLNSPFLIFGAAIMGLITVYLINALKRTGLVDQDAAIGIVFPLLFSIGVLLISLATGNIHLDVDTVLLGKIELAPFDFLSVNGMDLGAKSIYIALTCFLINGFFVYRFFKELKLITFDPDLALALGLPLALLNFIFISLVSITTVASFSALGSILVICLMVGPAASAYLLSKDLKRMILISMAFGVLDVVLGTLVAFYFDLSIAGTCAFAIGINFLLCFLFAPEEGVLAVKKKRQVQRYKFLQLNILFHLYNHKGTEEYIVEAQEEEMNQHLRLEDSIYRQILLSLEEKSWVEIKQGIVNITSKGEEYLLKESETLGLLDRA